MTQANHAPHLGIAMGRARVFFGKLMTVHRPNFPALFRAAAGLAIDAHLVTAAALASYTLARPQP